MWKLIKAINWEVACLYAFAVLSMAAIGWTSYCCGFSQANADTAARVQRQSTPEAVEAARKLRELAGQMNVYPFEKAGR